MSQIWILFSFLLVFTLFICGVFISCARGLPAYIYVCLYHVCLMSEKVRRGFQIPWN